MMQAVWWIPAIDWRISAGVIFFIQLVVWGYRIEKKKHYGRRVTLAFFLLCGVSWIIRYILEEWISAKIFGALGYGLYLWALVVVFILMFRFCNEIADDLSYFMGILALTVYRMCWDAVKLISSIPIGTDAGWTGGSPIQSLGSYALYLFVIAVCCKAYCYFIKRQARFPLYAVRTIYGVVLFLQMVLEFAFQFFYREEGSLSMLYFLTALLYCLISYTLLVVIAYVSLLQQDYVTMQNFIKSRQQYYEVSKDGILSLQIKCHDLKHQIAQIRSAAGKREMDTYISGLEDCIDEYNTVIDSGNQNVDVVLTEKNIICSVNGIRFTYIIDGTLLSFLSEMEIYALLGNALDNALEGMEHVEIPEKRFITLKAAQRDEMVILVVENYLEGDLTFVDGLPVTTKPDGEHHGFGLRSIREIAEEHGGGISVHTEPGLFRLTVTMEGR